MSATINQSYSDAIRQILLWLVPELTLVHEAYELALSQEPVTAIGHYPKGSPYH
jgi:hypothetical protein